MSARNALFPRMGRRRATPSGWRGPIDSFAVHNRRYFSFLHSPRQDANARVYSHLVGRDDPTFFATRSNSDEFRAKYAVDGAVGNPQPRLGVGNIWLYMYKRHVDVEKATLDTFGSNITSN